jgi:maleylpyruvate isomerase
MGNVYAVEQGLGQLAGETAGLLAGIEGLTDADARGASLLPGWTRGHVLTHLARNAEGGARLLGWARTGVPSFEYRSVTARAAAIEQGAGRPAAVLVADVRATAGAFADAAAAMPPGAWQNPVRWTTGQQTAAEMIVRSRLAEVLIHHVDLGLGYRPGDWPGTFVDTMLTVAVSALNEGGRAPMSARLSAADTGRQFRISGDAAGNVTIRGTEAELLAWVLGRSDGDRLAHDGPGPLPPMPSIYHT